MIRAIWNTAPVAEIAEKVAMGPFGSSIKVETFVEIECHSLRLIHDALLPKLISGEIRVPEAERLVQDATTDGGTSV